MSLAAVVALCCIAVVAIASTVIGSFGVRFARNTSDFLVASRTVGTTANASAISGEYLSAASFLGVVGLVLKDGPDALWYPVGFTAGYLMMLLFVSAPLRRCGAYTLPDFVEFRLRSRGLQRLSSGLTLIIGWLFLAPQLQGAGLTVATVVPGLPSWTGVVTAGLMVVATVAFGAMRSITFVQAFQYWLKLTALAVPVLVLLTVVGLGRLPYDRPAPPRFDRPTTVAVHTGVLLRVAEPVALFASGTVDRAPVDGTLYWGSGVHSVVAGTTLRFAAGSAVPVPAGAPALDSEWLSPASGRDRDPVRLYALYSLLVACFLGAVGLPHVLVRFSTSPDGRATRRTAVVVLALLGGFYLLPTVLGALSRWYVPRLLVSGDTDAAVLLLPTSVLGGGPPGIALGGLVAAGAWAAFLSTSSGLVVGIASVLSANPTMLRPNSWQDFRLAAAFAGLTPIVLALVFPRIDFMVAIADGFTVAASAFAPLLLLGIWWRGLTDRGAMAGMVVGGFSSGFAVLLWLLGFGAGRPYEMLLARPALISVPLAFLATILVSKMTPYRIPLDVRRTMLRLHAPERLGLAGGDDGDEGEEPADRIPGWD